MVYIVFLFTALAAVGQTAAINGICSFGGTHAVTQGMNATNFQQGVIPSCTVTVYLTGTLTKATIYADSLSTALSNPFTANAAGSVAPGQWIFFAAINQGYDVVMSGGVSPNIYSTPVTLTDMFPGSSFSGVTGSGTIGYIPVFTGANSLGNSVIDQDVTTAGAVTIMGHGLQVFSDFASGDTNDIMLTTGTGGIAQTFYSQTATGINIGIRDGGFHIFGNGSGTGRDVTFGMSYGNVLFENSTSDGSAPVEIYGSGGTCANFFENQECGLAVSNGTMMYGPLGIDAEYYGTGEMRVVAPIDNTDVFNSALGLTIRYPQGAATAHQLVCLDSSGLAQTCAVSTSTWDGIETESFWDNSSYISAQVTGITKCTFDNTAVLGDYVVPSSTVAGDCHDNGTVAGSPLIGKVEYWGDYSTLGVQLYPIGKQLFTSSVITTLGDTIYGGASGTATRLTGNTATAKNFLTQTGDGTISAAPAWGTISASDVPTLNQNTTGTAANITATSNSTLTTLSALSLPYSQVTGTPSTSTTVNGTTCTLGSSCTITAASSSIGYATLSSGTVTVSNTAACTPSATCVYKLTNCGINSSAAIGTLSVGTVVAGTSFVINSETALAALAVDNSKVCWQIN